MSTTQHVANGIIAFLDITLVRRRSDEKRAKRYVYYVRVFAGCRLDWRRGDDVHGFSEICVEATAFLMMRENTCTRARVSYRVMCACTPRRICFVFALSYQLWSLLCRYMNGHFPYPFLTRLSVRNYVIFIAVFISLFFVFFEIGKVIARIADSYWTSSEAKRGARGSKKRAQ